MSLGNRTAILTLSRLANYGLMLISPVLLVRLLDVESFGRYREFLLYASLLQGLAVFSINDSVLYCVPANPDSPWRVARQTVALTFCSSVLVAAALILIDAATGGKLVAGYLWPLVAYTLFSVNLDFWEFFWLANRRPGAVFIYSACRLAARVIVAVTAAATTHDVQTIIWSLVAFEGLRMVAAGIGLAVVDRSRHEPVLADPWRDQLRFCIPSGLGSVLSMLNRNLSNLAVARLLGPAALAQYAIGRFGEPIVVTLRNSVSTAALPEMVRLDRQSQQGGPLALWRRATVINTIFLFPAIALIVRYAQPLVVAVFGASYGEAAVVMQVYMLVVVRECFDFAPALRAINRTRPIVESNVAAIAVCAIALVVLIPPFGVAGAMLALVISSCVDVAWLGWRTISFYDVRLKDLLAWASIGKVALAALLACGVIASPWWTEALGVVGIVPAAATYLGVFAALLLMLRVPEAFTLLEWVKRLLSRRARAARPSQTTISRKA
jgi:O-antigen/teichoic acid export membrane protein